MSKKNTLFLTLVGLVALVAQVFFWTEVFNRAVDYWFDPTVLTNPW